MDSWFEYGRELESYEMIQPGDSARMCTFWNVREGEANKGSWQFEQEMARLKLCRVSVISDPWEQSSVGNQTLLSHVYRGVFILMVSVSPEV